MTERVLNADGRVAWEPEAAVVHRPGLAAPSMSDATADALPAPDARTLRVTAMYLLSETGRKASLLDGGDGRAEQVMDVAVPSHRLHLVTVDGEGHARLKLRPRYDVRPDGRVMQINASPVYDRPPTLDDLFLSAARNHELERAYLAQGGRRGRPRDAQRDLRAQLAQAFLHDPTQRALLHPPPSAKRCHLLSVNGRMWFDADRDEPPARDVPAEAHRRFRADERARRERNLEERARRLALHEEKKRFIAEWIATRGARDQQERQAAGLLPMPEAIEAIADEAFGPLREWPRYVRNGPEALQAHLRHYPKYENVLVAEVDVAVADSDATTATREQWARAQEARSSLLDATVTLRSHRLIWRRDPTAPSLLLHGLLVVRTVGPLVLRREFAFSN
jgi:hypothetical protein